MNVHLPPERELREPHQMVDRILEQTRHDLPSRRLRLRPAIGLALVAAITVTATVLGIRAASPQQAEVGEPPVVTAIPRPPSAVSPPLTTSVGRKVTFPDLAVTVHSAQQIQVNNRPADEYTISVTTCLRGLPSGSKSDRVRLRADSFTLNTGSATITVDDPIRAPVPLPATYPPDGSYRVGQCVSGVIPFGVDHALGVVSIDYANAFGDTASWTP